MNREKFVTLKNLEQYHNLLMKHLKHPYMTTINICPQCGGLIDDTNVCEYCGAKLKLVVDD